MNYPDPWEYIQTVRDKPQRNLTRNFFIYSLILVWKLYTYSGHSVHWWLHYIKYWFWAICNVWCKRDEICPLCKIASLKDLLLYVLINRYKDKRDRKKEDRSSDLDKYRVLRLAHTSPMDRRCQRKKEMPAFERNSKHLPRYNPA